MPALKLNRVISVFDIIGPVMIGPSSSHTAGAARIGYHAHQLLKRTGEEPKKIKIKLYNSFSGLQPEDEKIVDSEKLAEQKQVAYEIKWDLHSPDFHPNTAVIKIQGQKQSVTIIGYSLGGGLIKTFSEESFKPYQALAQNSNKTYFSLNDLGKKVNTGRQLVQLILAVEEKLAESRAYKEFLADGELLTGKITRAHINKEMFRRWQIMKESIEKGIHTRKKGESGMFGEDANRIWQSKLNLISQVIEDGITFSVAVAEHNARMGKIVAAPTAGSCGIVPGTLGAMQKKFHFQDNEIVQALLVAAAFGAITARQVELAGAVAGCQAEIGVAGAMAAAAGTYLLGGNLKKMENAASLVLANLLGLTCDPVMGRVEVPCILRNGMITGMVMNAIELALDGINYYIPYDEVVTVMKNIGQDMDDKYRETSTGGLAKSKTACQVCSHVGQCSR